MAVICQRAQEHIHAGECILTYGYSKIVEQFLKAAGAKRKFQVRLSLKQVHGVYCLCEHWNGNLGEISKSCFVESRECFSVDWASEKVMFCVVCREKLADILCA